MINNVKINIKINNVKINNNMNQSNKVINSLNNIINK